MQDCLVVGRFHALVVVVALAACARSDDTRRCAELGDGSLRSASIEVRIRSQVQGNGELVAGEVPDCSAVPAASAQFVAASAALASIPASLRPSRIVVHNAPILPLGARLVEQLEMHRPSGSLLAAGPAVPRAIWLHEIAHLRMLGQRPTAPVAQRLFAAIEEGIADYYAGIVLQSPRLAERSLDRPPHLVVDDWAALALDSFDPHRLGWALAASLWAREPQASALLEDVVDCLASARAPTEPRASAIVAAWASACPERSRAAIQASLCSWLPPELASGC